MGRKKNPTSEMDVAEKMKTPLAQRLDTLITDANALKDHLSCSIQAINQYRLGVSRPSLENLCKIADFYGVSTDYLLGRTDIPTNSPDIQAACLTTGLSEKAISRLHELSEYSKANLPGLVINPFEALLSSDGPAFELRPDKTTVSAFKVFCVELTSYLHNRVNEQEPPGLTEEENHELFVLSESLETVGLTIMSKHDAAEIHLQTACDAMKALFRAWNDEGGDQNNGKH